MPKKQPLGNNLSSSKWMLMGALRLAHLDFPMLIMNGLEVIVSQLLKSGQIQLVENVVSRFVFERLTEHPHPTKCF